MLISFFEIVNKNTFNLQREMKLMSASADIGVFNL